MSTELSTSLRALEKAIEGERRNQVGSHVTKTDKLFDECQRLTEEVEKDRNNLRAFIEELVSSQAWGNEIHFPDDMDGGTIQDLAERMAILKAVDHPEPCSVENCPCIENGPFDYLYHFTWAMP